MCLQIEKSSSARGLGSSRDVAQASEASRPLRAKERKAGRDARMSESCFGFRVLRGGQAGG